MDFTEEEIHDTIIDDYNSEGSDPTLTFVDNYYNTNLFLVEDLLSLYYIDNFELGMFSRVPLGSIIYNYPVFRVEEHYTQHDMINFYHSTSNNDYKLLQILVNGFKRRGVDLYWLGSPIFFGQL
jgi:hypothetical protein